MKLFIWEGDGISSAYHDDGTLVVLAHDPVEARDIVRASKVLHEEAIDKWNAERDELSLRLGTFGWQTPESAELGNRHPGWDGHWDGDDAGLDREPDRVIDLDAPTVVVFNGGGYD